MLCFLHGIDKTWPNVDGTQDALSAIARKLDRPLPDEIMAFIRFFFAPFTPTGRVLYSPYATMLADHTPSSLSLESGISELEDALRRTSAAGLPFGFSMKQRMMDVKRELEREGAPASVPLQPEEGSSKSEADLFGGEMECRQGRYVKRDSLVPMVDRRWKPKDILALEFCVSRYCDTMLIATGPWSRLLPEAPYHLDLRLPYIEGIPPEALAEAVIDDPDAYKAFRKAIRQALSEAIACERSESFSKQLKRIQEEIIDDGIATLDKAYRDLMKRRFARYGAYAVGAIGIEIGLYFGASLAQIAALVSTSAAANFFFEIDKRISEKDKLESQPMFFIWKLRKKARR